MLGTIALPGSDGYFRTGLDVAEDGSFWVTQESADQVHHLDSSGNLIATFAFSPPSFPFDVAVRNDGQIFATGFLPGDVWQLDPATGEFSFFASVNEARGLNFTPDGDLTVGGLNSGIYRFDSDGNQLQQIPTSASDPQVDLQNNVWTPFSYTGNLGKYDTAGNLLFYAPSVGSPGGLAVIGVDGPEPVQPVPGDYYSFTLGAGQSLTLAMDGAGSVLNLELVNSDGIVLAAGVSAANLDQVISNFTAATAGTYYAHVTRSAGNGDYSLIVTRDAVLDIEENATIDIAQPLDLAAGSATVLGHVEDSQTPLYTTGNDGNYLISIDSGTGAGTVVGPFGTYSTYAAAFTPDGTLWTIIYAYDSSLAQLATVDLGTGATTPIGSPVWTSDVMMAARGRCSRQPLRPELVG